MELSLLFCCMWVKTAGHAWSLLAFWISADNRGAVSRLCAKLIMHLGFCPYQGLSMLVHDPVARSQLITFFLFVFGTPVGMSRSRPWSKRSCSGWPKEKGKQLVRRWVLPFSGKGTALMKRGREWLSWWVTTTSTIFPCGTDWNCSAWRGSLSVTCMLSLETALVWNTCHLITLLLGLWCSWQAVPVASQVVILRPGLQGMAQTVTVLEAARPVGEGRWMVNMLCVYGLVVWDSVFF